MEMVIFISSGLSVLEEERVALQAVGEEAPDRAQTAFRQEEHSLPRVKEEGRGFQVFAS
jgi:hypothetical protein